MKLDISNWKSFDSEKRELRVKVATFERSLKIQKGNNTRLQKEIGNWKARHRKQISENEGLRKQIDSLLEKISKIERQRDKYKSLLFKKNSKSPALPPLAPEAKRQLILAKTKRGAKTGHVGYFRSLPKDVDTTKRVFLSVCSHCGGKLKRANSTQDHLVEDVPLESIQTVITSWQIERQWCPACKKEVKAAPKFVIPNCRFGINILTYILVLRYATGLSISKIRKILFDTYNIEISAGGIVSQLKLAKKYLQNDYQKILDHVRASPVKHADETSWRVAGINTWVWAFLTKEDIYLTIEEGRGKAVPEEKLKGSTEEDVLVRDDYGSYKKLPMNHQSCWAHLLKEARFEVQTKGSSEEVKLLNSKLKGMFGELKDETEKPFNTEKRDLVYRDMKLKLDKIIETKFTKPDSMRIQKRIRNQGDNLLTALKYPGVPLTNNLAERSLRPMVITRKLTGGSRSHLGAQTHAINMSVIQTIMAQQKELIPTLKEYLFLGSTEKR